MFAEFGFPLELDAVFAVPVPVLLASVSAWLEKDDPICLMHPNGFYVVLLARTETEDWRFHFWPTGPRPIVGIPSSIHTHDRHVESRILQGQVTNIVYDIKNVADHGRPIYEVEYGGDRYTASTSNSLRLTNERVVASIRSRETSGIGDTYHVERHDFHEAVVSEDIATATLVCFHGRSPGPVRIIGVDGYPEVITFSRAEYRAHSFSKQLRPI